MVGYVKMKYVKWGWFIPRKLNTKSFLKQHVKKIEFLMLILQ